MPSAMIHLLTARDYDPAGGALYLLGSIAPDYARERTFKDAIHLRDRADRAAALDELRDQLDLTDGFSLGWLLHLFTDHRWDESHLRAYRETHEQDADWFRGYHRELHSAGYALYHRCDWAEPANAAILAVGLSSLPAALPADPAGIEEFRSILIEKTRESDAAVFSAAFPPELLEPFAAETAAAFRAWLEARA